MEIWKNYIFNLIGISAALVVAKAIERIGYPYIGWFMFGVIFGIPILFNYTPKGKRWTARNLSLFAFSGIVISLVYNIVEYYIKF